MLKINQKSYQKMIEEDVQWLLDRTEDDLERRHIIDLLYDSIRVYYSDPQLTIESQDKHISVLKYERRSFARDLANIPPIEAVCDPCLCCPSCLKRYKCGDKLTHYKGCVKDEAEKFMQSKEGDG